MRQLLRVGPLSVHGSKAGSLPKGQGLTQNTSEGLQPLFLLALSCQLPPI